MTNLKVMKAQCKLALRLVDARTAIGIVNYINALERQVEADAAKIEAGKKLLQSIQPSTDPESRYYDIDPQDVFDAEVLK